jgi:hypothetical protein
VAIDYGRLVIFIHSSVAEHNVDEYLWVSIGFKGVEPIPIEDDETLRVAVDERTSEGHDLVTIRAVSTSKLANDENMVDTTSNPRP